MRNYDADPCDPACSFFTSLLIFIVMVSIAAFFFALADIIMAPRIDVTVDYSPDTVIVRATASRGAYIIDPEGNRVNAWSYAGSPDEVPNVLLKADIEKIPLNKILSMGCTGQYSVSKYGINVLTSLSKIVFVGIVFAVGAIFGYMLGRR